MALACGDDDVGRARFAGDVACGKFERTAPLDVFRPAVHACAELLLDLRQAHPDRGLALIDEILGEIAGHEIRPGHEIGRLAQDSGGNSDHLGVEFLGNLTGDLEDGLVRLVDRQADHHGRI
jgi:hypothetical protein